jgi:hypothetical protein
MNPEGDFDMVLNFIEGSRGFPAFVPHSKI